jgi:hypothetical protein
VRGWGSFQLAISNSLTGTAQCGGFRSLPNIGLWR